MKITVKSISIACAASVVMFVSACSPTSKEEKTNRTTEKNSGGSGDVKQAGTVNPNDSHDTLSSETYESSVFTFKKEDAGPMTENAKLRVSLALRSFDQVSETMATLTGVPSSEASVQTTFKAVFGSLPNSTDAKSFGANNQVGIFKLGTAYCEALIAGTNYAAQRTAIFGTVNFAQNVNVVFAGQAKDDIAQKMIDRFWGKGLKGLPDNADTKKTVTTLIDEIIAKAAPRATPAAEATFAQNVGVAACTAVLISAPAMIY